MLAELAVRADGLFGRLLGLTGRVLERLNLLVDFVELPGPLVQRRETPRDLIELRRRAGRLLGELLERLAHRRELGAARRERVEHLAQGAALFACRRDQLFEFVSALLR